MIGGVAVEGGCLHRGWKAGRSRVDFWGGAEYPEGGEPTFVPQEEVKRGEAGLDGQNIGGGAEETIGGPPLDLMPEDGELSYHVGSGGEDVRAIAEDREEERGGHKEIGGGAPLI